MRTGIIRDEELVAFLDDEIDPARRALVEAELAGDADLRRRLDALTIDRAVIRDAFGSLQNHAPVLPDLPVQASKPGLRRRMMPFMAASFVGGLGIGAVLAFSLGESRAGWKDYVASYQALYVSSTLSEVEQPRALKLAELAAVTNAIGKPIDLDVFTEESGLDYRRAQILGFEGKPLAQFAFLSRSGAPLALCIINMGDAADQPVTAEVREGLSAASWAKGGYAFLLIGGTDNRIVETAAHRFAALL